MATAPQLTADWWKSFADEDYARLWREDFSAEVNRQQTDALWSLLRLRQGSRVLDAGCGYGRLSRPLAERGAMVTGADHSADLLAIAERERGGVPEARLRYVRHDLREPLPEGGFDAALNVFTSIGFGTEDDDLAIFATLNQSVRSGGLVFIDTMPRDAVVALLAGGPRLGRRHRDGTLVYEEMAFDPISGRLLGTWYWTGPNGSGQKSAWLRVYTAGELVAMLGRAGLRFLSAHAGISPAPFKAEGPAMGGRIGLLAQRPE